MTYNIYYKKLNTRLFLLIFSKILNSDYLILDKLLKVIYALKRVRPKIINVGGIPIKRFLPNDSNLMIGS